MNNCAICDASPNEVDMRLRTKLRGICYLCAAEGGFVGFTSEEVTRCVSVANAIIRNIYLTSEQRRHQKDMES